MKFELNFRNNFGTDQELLEDIKRISEKLKQDKLTSREYDENGGQFSSGTVSRRFGGWNKALEKAGVGITVLSNISKDNLLQNLEEVWITLGRQPTSREMRQPLSNYSQRGYITTFGSWRKALVEFVEYINSASEPVEEHNSNETVDSDSQEPTYKHKTKRIPSERLKVQVLMRDGNKCRLCGVIVTGDNIHFDHITPWSKGGETVLENLQVLCAPHNLAKGDC